MVLMRGLLQDGDKLAMISAKQVLHETAQGALVALPVPLGDSPRAIGLTHRQDWTPTPTQARFMNLLRAVSADIGA